VRIGRRGKQAAKLLLAIAAGTVVGLAIFWENIPSVALYSQSFDSATWKSSPAEFTHKSRRLRMADDLLKTHPLVGLDRAAIGALLGDPDQTPYFRGYDMVYFLGQERSYFGIDGEWLVIKLDSAGVATEAKLVTD